MKKDVLEMKRILLGALLVCMVWVIAMLPAEAGYSKYLNGDTNYVLVYGHMGVAFYLDKSSVVAKQDDSTAHAFAENILSVDSDGNITGNQTYWYYQKVDSQDLYEAYKSNDGNHWNSFEINDDSGAMAVVVQGFKYGWPIAFGYGWS